MPESGITVNLEVSFGSLSVKTPAKSKFPVVRQNIDFISALIGSTLPLLLVFFFYFDILSPVIELYTWSLYFPNS